jgi:hypothetical protein
MTKQLPVKARRPRRPATVLRLDPASETWLKQRLESPEGQALLLELARVYARAAVDAAIEDAEREASGTDPMQANKMP